MADITQVDSKKIIVDPVNQQEPANPKCDPLKLQLAVSLQTFIGSVVDEAKSFVEQLKRGKVIVYGYNLPEAEGFKVYPLDNSPDTFIVKNAPTYQKHPEKLGQINPGRVFAVTVQRDVTEGWKITAIKYPLLFVNGKGLSIKVNSRLPLAEIKLACESPAPDKLNG